MVVRDRNLENLKKNLVIFFSIILAGFTLDRILKHIVFSKEYLGGSTPVIGHILYITPTTNTGAAFGLMKGSAGFLTWLSLALLLAIIFSMKIWAEHRQYSIILGMIGAGILGNLYDRLIYGFVLDFIDIKIWPVFNLADSLMSIGCAAIALTIIFDSFCQNSHKKSVFRKK